MMAIKDWRRRLGKMERRFLVEPIKGNPDSHVELARDLSLSRMVLNAEREALRLLNAVRQSAGKNVAWIGSQERVDADIGRYEEAIRASEGEVAENERRCTEAGLTEEDINRLAS
jgi:hypothetical protein